MLVLHFILSSRPSQESWVRSSVRLHPGRFGKMSYSELFFVRARRVGRATQAPIAQLENVDAFKKRGYK